VLLAPGDEDLVPAGAQLECDRLGVAIILGQDED
jgi:hypothetical protein